MLTKDQAYSPPNETNMTLVEELFAKPGFVGRYARELASFVAIVVQFGLLVLVVSDWQLENLSVSRLMQLAFVGFVIHHLLPIRFRLRFFAALSMAAVVLIVGEMGTRTFVGALTGRVPLADFVYPLIPGVALVAVGLGLIGICHLPIRFGARVALIAVVGAGLAFLRAHSEWFPDVKEMWVILGSMFMFRLMIYLYDLKDPRAPFSPARAISYFFMLPNICFPLFPVVNYETFTSTYYNEDWRRIYQTGLKWMFRGVIQLLLYRLIYQYAPLDVSKLSSTLDAAGFMIGMYLLYLRISGTFHLIIGLLHMFGFNLPETHHLYLLSSSFTDFWRRINIYWKDFVMKLFFYPIHFKFRKLGPLWALSIATLMTFLATWLLHSWQWFWIRGKPLLDWKDFSFWMILGVLVLVTAIYETTRGRKRALSPSRFSMRTRLMLGLQAGVFFCGMCVLWAYWSCQSWGDFQTLLDAASKPSWRDIAIILGVFALVCICGTVWGRSTRETSEGQSSTTTLRPFRFWPSAAAVAAGSICLLVLPSLATRTMPGIEHIVARLHSDVLNAGDMALQRRGYYEDLDVGRMDKWQWQRQEGTPEGWADGKKVFYRERSDFLFADIVPSVSTVMGGAPISSNALGMRDREYTEVKPANTYRMVLLGASHDLGTGVKDNETYENLVEDRLNDKAPDPRYSRYEILNMSVGGSDILQRLLRLQKQGLRFAPDAAILSVAAHDRQFVIEHFRKILTLGTDLPPDFREIFERIVGKAHLHAKMPKAMIERRLQGYVGEIYEWAFRHFGSECRRRGIRPIVIYRPAPVDFEGVESASRSEIIPLVEAAGLEVIDLSDAFDTVTDRDSLIVAKWEDHTTPLGHRLLADKLYERLVPLLRRASTTVLSTDNQPDRRGPLKPSTEHHRE
jgi:alginate O-acetyltransferase complex protein AlgI